MGLLLVLGHLFGFPRAQQPDEDRDQKERAGRQHKEPVGVVPAPICDEWQHFKAVKLTAAKELPKEADKQQHDGVADTIADPVEDAGEWSVLHRKRFRTSHDDTLVMINPTKTERALLVSKTNALRTWSVMMTSEAMMVSCTMILMLGGILLRRRLTVRFDNVITAMTARHMTTEVSSFVVTASAEQIQDLKGDGVVVEQRIYMGLVTLAHPSCPRLLKLFQVALEALLSEPEPHEIGRRGS